MKAIDSKTNDYLDMILENDPSMDKASLLHYIDFLFSPVECQGKRVLDIGGGGGMASFYAHCKGASRVVCLEPEAAGSTTGVCADFQKMAARIGAQNVELVNNTFQEYSAEPNSFDIIILDASINHLDEDACINLLKNQKARETYMDIFNKMFTLAASGADIIIRDVSNLNVFPLLGLTNPKAKTIEWFKHQRPGTWASMLKAAGFTSPKTKWYSYRRLGPLGQVVFGNCIGSFFLTSTFCLQMKKP